MMSGLVTLEKVRVLKYGEDVKRQPGLRGSPPTAKR
jgi:hypothetical protein